MLMSELRSNIVKWFKRVESSETFDHQSHLAISTVEITVSLLIFGVLCGCVLQTRDMIQQNQARALMDKASQIQAGVIAYKDTHQVWPGSQSSTSDHPQSDHSQSDTYRSEAVIIEHLYEAGYLTNIPITYSDHPECHDGVCLENGFGDWLTVNSSAEGYEINLGELPTRVFHLMDERFDDGVIHSGAIRARSLSGQEQCVDSTCLYTVSIK